ncbi:MAG: hypothetical protein ACKVOP_11975 [Sphingomonadaceae bacterium]
MMARFEVRQSVSLPLGAKSALKEAAAKRGISLSALMRDIVFDLIAERELNITRAEIELRRGVTIQ